MYKRKANHSRNRSPIKNVTSTPKTFSIFHPSLNNNACPSNQNLIPYRSQNIKHRRFSHKRGGNESVLIAGRIDRRVSRGQGKRQGGISAG